MESLFQISIIVRAYPGVGEITLEAGERICQGIILNYGTVAMDIPRAKARTGGFGSTDKVQAIVEDIVEAELIDEMAAIAMAKEEAKVS